VTRLRFRIIDITTHPANNFGNAVATCNGSTCVADMRALTSVNTSVSNPCGGGTTSLTGTTLEGPAQPNGGGYNSSLTVIPPSGSLANGASINVRWLLGVQQNGKFRFFITVEALP
jgi:hypothetical protein